MKKEQASLVTITDKANNHLSGIVVKNKVKGVSLSVDGGGCAGFNYKWNILEE